MYHINEEELRYYHDDLDTMHNAESLLSDGEISGLEEGFIRGYMGVA